jgi:hypothetical protein
MSGPKKEDRSRDNGGKSSPVSGAGLGLLSRLSSGDIFADHAPVRKSKSKGKKKPQWLALHLSL